MIGKIKQQFLNVLPRSLALKLYLLRNSSYAAKGTVFEDIELELIVPRRNKLWIERIESGNGHEIGICELLAKEIGNSVDYIYCDVGSCFGFFPALLSKMNRDIKIFAFEAGWQQYYFLQKTKELYSSLNQWNIENKYVGSISNDKFVKLDDYFGEKSIIPHLIQIDVDGFENEVLLGCKNIIKRKETKFLLELHPLILANFNTSIEEVLSHFEGYSMRILPNLRDGNVEWSEDLDLVYKDENPYLIIIPN